MIFPTRSSIECRSTQHLRTQDRPSYVSRRFVSVVYGAWLFGGLVVGQLFGDRALPSLGAALGDPLADVFLGVFGGLCAGIAYETVGEVLVILLQPRHSSS